MTAGKGPAPTSWIICLALGLTFANHAAAVDLYDAARDKQAADAKAAWHAIDLDVVVGAEQANLKSLLAAELSAQDDLATSIRDHHLRAFIETPLRQTQKEATSEAKGASPYGLLNLIEKKLTFDILSARADGAAFSDTGVVGETELKYQERDAQRDVSKRNIEAVQPMYDKFGMGTADCVDAITPPPPRIQALIDKQDEKGKAVIRAAMTALLQACTPETAIPKLSGELKIASDQLAEAMGAKQDAETTLASAKSAYKAALTEYTNATAANVSSTPTTAKRLKDADAAVANALDQFDALGGATHGLTTQYVSGLRLDKLKDFLDVVTADEESRKLAATDSKSEADFVLASQLIDGVKKSLSDSKAPLNLPLTLYRDQQQLKLAAATLQVAAWKNEIELTQKLVDTLISELHALMHARRLLTDSTRGGDMTRLTGVRFDEAFAKGSSDVRARLLSAATAYLDVVGRLDAQRYKLQYLRIAANYDQTLAYDAINVKRWQSLISVSVDQTSDFYAGGIKPDLLAGLWNSVMLLGIGYGVNK